MQAFDTFFSAVSQAWAPIAPYAGTIGLILLAIMVLYFVVRTIAAAMRKKNLKTADEVAAEQELQEKKSEEEAEQRITAAAVNKSILEGIRTLNTHALGREHRYQTPWFLVIGNQHSQPETLLRRSGLEVLQSPAADSQALSWWFYTSGVSIAVDGSIAVPERRQKVQSDRLWTQILHQMRRYRPERPCDGFVITVSVRDILASLGDDIEAANAFKKLSQQLFDRMVEAQKELGLRFPIYLVLTGTEAITGFAEFARALPEHLRDSILGWSSPYTLDTAYAGTWIDEAFDAIGDNLTRLQLEMFVEQAEDDRDKLFLFPLELDRLRQGVKAITDTLFRGGIYHESFYFRGIYLVGDTRMDNSGAEPLAFARHVFSHKVFPEHYLARAAERSFVARNRSLSIARTLFLASVVLATSGTFLGWETLEERHEQIFPLLKEMADDIQEQRQQGPPTEEQELQRRRRTYELFQRYNSAFSIEARLTSWWYPVSWWSDIHDDISRAMAITYQNIVARSIWQATSDRLNHIVSYDAAPFDSSASSTSAFRDGLDKIEEFRQFSRYVNDVAEFESYADLYDNIQSSGTGSLDRYVRLIEYLFDLDIDQQGSEHHYYYFKNAIQLVEFPKLNRTDWQPRARRKFQMLADRLERRLFEFNPIIQSVRRLSTVSDALRSGNIPTAAEAVMLLKSAQQELNVLSTLSDDKSTDWMTKHSLNLGSAFTTLRNKTRASKLLGADLDAALAASAASRFALLKQKLNEKNTIFGSAVIAVVQDDLVFTDHGRSLTRDINLVLSQPFVGSVLLSDSAHTAPTVQHSASLIWNDGAIAAANADIANYQSFAQTILPALVPDLQMVAKNVGRKGLNQSLDSRCGAMLTPNPLSSAGMGLAGDLDSEVMNLVAVSEPLSTLISAAAGLQLPVADRFRSMVQRQLTSMLLSIDAVSEELYEWDKKSLAKWDGTSPLGPVLFSFEGGTDPATWLGQQRAEIEHLASDQAKPILSFAANNKVNLSGGSRGADAKWRSIVSTLERYDRAKADNSLVRFEGFVNTVVDTITFANYERYTKPSGESSSDFFGSRLLSLKSAISGRAKDLAGVRARDGYAALAKMFNSTLAGRFPFSAQLGDENTLLEARPSDVRAFLQSWREWSAVSLSAFRAQAGRDSATRRAVAFLESIAAVDKFFAAWAHSGADTPPSYDLDVDFRVNRQSEVEGRQIADWTLSIGGRTISFRDAKRSGVWSFGDRVRYAMRWALNSPMMPRRDSLYTAMRVDGNAVVFEYNNQWSLISFLRNHNAPAGEYGRLDPSRVALVRFDIPLRPASASALGTSSKNSALVYTEIVLQGAGDELAGRLPAFPVRAPELP